MGFTEGQRVVVKAAIGVGPKGTVVSVEGDAVHVRLDGKTKPKHYAASKLAPVRAEIDLIERGPVRVPPRQGTTTRRVTYDAPPLRPQPKSEGPYVDREYTDFVRSQPCCGCGSTEDIHVHHWADAEIQRRGKGQKVDDVYVVPLCWRCHEHVHNKGAGALPGKNLFFTQRVFLVAQVRLLAAVRKGAL